MSSVKGCTPAKAEIIKTFDNMYKLRVYVNCKKPFDQDVDPKLMPCILPQTWRVTAVMESN